MKRLLLVGIVVLLSGCATLENPYSKFYQDRTGGVDLAKSDMVILPKGDPQIYTGNNVDADAQKMYEDGYNLIGFSSFNAGEVDKGKLIAQARKVKAEVVIFYSQYTNTLSGVMPLTLPDNHTVTTTYTGNSNISGNIYGSGGGWANYSGSGSSFGTANTTIYGSKTTYIPYSQNRYDYMASYWIKMKKPIFGVLAVDLTSEQRSKIGTNKGAFVNVVVKGSPAFLADIFKGDIITKINEEDVKDAADLELKVNSNFGKTIAVALVREGNVVTKDIQLSQGETVQDFKYGEIGEFLRFYYDDTQTEPKTAFVTFSKVFDAYNKSRAKGWTWDAAKAGAYQSSMPEIMGIVKLIDGAIKDYGVKNQYKAIYSHKVPNINETDEVSDAIVAIINGKK